MTEAAPTSSTTAPGVSFVSAAAPTIHHCLLLWRVEHYQSSMQRHASEVAECRAERMAAEEALLQTTQFIFTSSPPTPSIIDQAEL